jgi:hypothetical protein
MKYEKIEKYITIFYQVIKERLYKKMEFDDVSMGFRKIRKDCVGFTFSIEPKYSLLAGETYYIMFEVNTKYGITTIKKADCEALELKHFCEFVSENTNSFEKFSKFYLKGVE